MAFSITSLFEDQISEMKSAGVWSEDCPVHYSMLRTIEVDFFDFEETRHAGKLVVLDEVAGQVVQIFSELFAIRFPIGQVTPIEKFGGNDVRSMEANNSSAFNGRKIMNSQKWSSHAFGVAIDINPCQNPYMLPDKVTSTIKVYPSEAIDYVNRTVQKPGMTELVKDIFFEYGFTEWGGNWPDRPDYHHFQLPWARIRKLFPEVL